MLGKLASMAKGATHYPIIPNSLDSKESRDDMGLPHPISLSRELTTKIAGKDRPYEKHRGDKVRKDCARVEFKSEWVQ